MSKSDESIAAFIRGDGLFQATLKRNAALCKLCGTVAESTHRHHSASCECGNITVDGGLAYARRMWRSDEWVDLSEPAESATGEGP